SYLWLSAFLNTEGRIDLNSRFDWDIIKAWGDEETELDNRAFGIRGQLIGHYDKTSSNLGTQLPNTEVSWVQGSANLSYFYNNQHSLFLEPLVRWNFNKAETTGRSQSQLFFAHEWRPAPKWTLTNRFGLRYFGNQPVHLCLEPQVKYESSDWSIGAFLRKKLNISNKQEDTYMSSVMDPDQTIGGELTFYKSINSNLDRSIQTFDIALTGEYSELPDGRSDKQFGIKLDISH
ncbi:MAG: hypothetical protein ACPGVN_09590, partial [Alphaproteobacteria bacterium]